MWPKALAQLIELAPHITRLIPMADRFFQSKTAGEEASRNAMEQMAQGLRGDLGQVTAAHAGLYQQLNQQGDKLATIAADVQAGRVSLDSLEAQIARLEVQFSRLQLSVVAAIVLLVAICILSILTLVHLH